MSSAPAAQAVRAVACLVVMLSNADAAPLSPSPEDRYIATRDAAIERFSSIYDAGRFDDAAKNGADTARADLQAQMRPHGSRNPGLASPPHPPTRTAPKSTDRRCEWRTGQRSALAWNVAELPSGQYPGASSAP
jgi:hypothetical protein